MGGSESWMNTTINFVEGLRCFSAKGQEFFVSTSGAWPCLYVQ